MKPEKQQLIHDLLGGEGMREATLLAGGRALRRRRCWRMASGSLAFGLVLITATILFERANSPRRSGAMLAQVSVSQAATPLTALTDDQLLALFPDTPVGLVTLPDGRKRLVFPRAGDEHKFFTRL